jgi:hypothetical protein
MSGGYPGVITKQFLYNNVSSGIEGTALVPVDNTIPQITEGTEYLTIAITPSTIGSRILIEADLIFYSSVLNIIITSLYKDSSANALKSIWQGTSNSYMETLTTLRYVYTPVNLTPIVFSVRAGLYLAGSLALNGIGGLYLGGSLTSSISATEYVN